MSIKTQQSRKPKIVVIGGGTGLPVLLKSMRNQGVNITAIVTVADDGGSSGELRESITSMAPPGDLRNVLVALSDMPKLYSDIFQYRFKKEDKLSISFGEYLSKKLEIKDSKNLTLGRIYR